LSEENWVDRINEFIGAKAHKIKGTSTDLVHHLDKMLKAQGEPFGSTSIFAQYLVSKLAGENGITVTLDGQGADELLAGYDGYPGQRLLSLLEQGRIFAAHRFAHNWADWPGRNYKLAWMYFGRIKLPDNLYKKARKILGRDFSPSWLKIDMLREAGVQFIEKRAPLSSVAKGRRVAEELARSLQHRGLPELLRHADRNSMYYSIESRVPFLTLPLADLLLSLPEHYLISDSGETKSVFRTAMKDIVPYDTLNRKDKIGFATPEEEWLLGMSSIVREWLQDSDQIPFLNREPILKIFNDAVNVKKVFNCQIWRWINYVRWYIHMGMCT
jgi:asparagine synthase (glutamine-hydrolysing)